MQVLIFLSIVLANLSCDIDHPVLDQHLNDMESALRRGDMLQVAAFYTDDGYLIGPGGIISQGREAINDYWTSMQNPVDWQLESFAVYDQLEDMAADSTYLSWSNPPPLWSQFDISLDSDKRYLYQVGRSTLVTKRNGVEQTSIVHFLLAWEEIHSKEYRIVVDSYAGIH